MNRNVIALCLATALPLAACSQDAAETVAGEGIAGLEITDARMALPAVSGNPAAIYMDIAYEGDRNIAIRSVDVAGAARAELHDVMEYDGEMVMNEMPPLMLTKGDTATFEPGGKHVMAFELDPSLTAGASTEVTFIIAGGDKHSFPVTIQAAGDDR